jgi:hypothetical protein
VLVDVDRTEVVMKEYVPGNNLLGRMYSRERFLRNDFLETTGQICNGVYIWTGARISSLSFSSPFSSLAPEVRTGFLEG